MRLLHFDFYTDSKMDPLAAMNTQIRMKTAKHFTGRSLRPDQSSVFISDLT